MGEGAASGYGGSARVVTRNSRSVAQSLLPGDRNRWKLQCVSDMDDIVKDFLIESNENLDQLDRDLIGLEKDPASAELLASVFRTIHTIKGTCGFLAFGKLEALTHAGESLLSRMRSGKLRLNEEIVSTLLAMVDSVRTILANIEQSGQEGDSEYQELIRRMILLQQAKPATNPVPASEVAVPPPTAAEESAKLIGQLLVEIAGVDPAAIETALQIQRQGDAREIGEILVDQGTVNPFAVRAVVEYQKKVRAQCVADTSVRVEVALLDKLMGLVGELILARNQILQFSDREYDSAFQDAAQRLNLITAELQALAMKTRMQPIGNLCSHLPRVVRDLALACGKQIRVEMAGTETELDKTLLEAIKDPLTHVVRNSVDHGIESPQQRREAGKPPEGCISLHASYEGGQVIIEIADDGAGINLERVKQKALSLGLISVNQAGRMTDREITSLVFLPGLSTAERVTKVSGRGVGMDVLKTNIEAIGGAVELQTKPGQGTTIRIKIPLTLAVIPAASGPSDSVGAHR